MGDEIDAVETNKVIKSVKYASFWRLIVWQRPSNDIAPPLPADDFLSNTRYFIISTSRCCFNFITNKISFKDHSQNVIF